MYGSRTVPKKFLMWRSLTHCMRADEELVYSRSRAVYIHECVEINKQVVCVFSPKLMTKQRIMTPVLNMKDK